MSSRNIWHRSSVSVWWPECPTGYFKNVVVSYHSELCQSPATNSFLWDFKCCIIEAQQTVVVSGYKMVFMAFSPTIWSPYRSKILPCKIFYLTSKIQNWMKIYKDANLNISYILNRKIHEVYTFCSFHAINFFITLLMENIVIPTTFAT